MGVESSAGNRLLAGFELSDGVMIALLTTSTATIVGVILVVARFLLPEDGP